MRHDFKEAINFTSRLWDIGEVVVVVSALEGVTDGLLKVLSGEATLQDIMSLHFNFARENRLPPSIFNESFRELKKAIKNKDNFSSEKAFRDYILSFGEWLAGIAFVETLRRKGIPAELFKPWEVIATNGKFGDADIELKTTKKLLSPVENATSEGEIAVIPGFVGGFNGLRVTLGRNGSDYTATALGTLLRSDVLIMSNVDGIYTADPHKVIRAKLIPHVDKDELYVASTAGMKAIFSKAVEVAKTQLFFGRTSDWKFGTVTGEPSPFPIITYRVEGERSIVTIVGTHDVPTNVENAEYGSCRGIPYVRIEIPKLRLGKTLNELNKILVLDAFRPKLFSG